MPKRARAPTASTCKHTRLQLEASENATAVGYKQPTVLQRQNAVQPTGRVSKKSPAAVLPPPSTFPAPLVLPNDELSWDPEYQTQSLKSNLSIRNAVTPRRRTIYVVPPPTAAEDVQYVNDFMAPAPGAKKGAKRPKASKSIISPPSIEEITSYLSAFYHGLPVKVLSDLRLEFDTWDGTIAPQEPVAGKANLPSYIGLIAGKDITRIRSRPSPDSLFATQLNLVDILDVALKILPADAFAIVMIVHQDMYEDEPDDFCCGRAYGGSRVSVVSTARYSPSLDEKQEVERVHAWPASHCRAFVEECCGLDVKGGVGLKAGGAMGAAMKAFNALPVPKTDEEIATLWLGRVCKTASHELGHCFGMDHCVWYACVMQSTAGLSEDARQPPYVCPADLAKLVTATGANERERYEALLSWTEKWVGDRLFSAFASWLRARIAEYEV